MAVFTGYVGAGSASRFAYTTRPKFPRVRDLG